MKETDINYHPPFLETAEVEVEQGFASSPLTSPPGDLEITDPWN